VAVITYSEALNQAMREEMRRDDRVFLLGEDIGMYGGAFRVTKGLFEEFGPKRVKDTPIAEEVIVGAAIGAAMVGLRPVAEIMTVNFILLAMDQIVNSAAHIHYMFGGEVRVPLVIRTPGGGGFQLAAQHSHSHENWFAHVPGLRVVAPASPADAKGMLQAAIRDDNPVMFIENEWIYNYKGEVPDGEHLVSLDHNEVKREGNDLTILAHSKMLVLALEAAAELEKDGISAEVVDMRVLRPLDMEPGIASVKKTNRAMTVEEGWRSFGIGSEVAARIYEEAFDYLDAPILRLGGAEVPMPYNKRLEKAALPQKADIVAGAHELVAKNGARR
jgi:pyruvate dehydrogenase E1 component beta subunit